MREINPLDILFGLFLAAIVVMVSGTVAGVIVFVVLDYGVSEGMVALLAISGMTLVAGMLVLASLYPGPGRIVERPLLAFAAFISLPSLSAVCLVTGVIHNDVSWYVTILFLGVFPSALMGFAVLFAILMEAQGYSTTKTRWPIDRPASAGGWGLRNIPRNQGMVYAGLARGGPEEQVPDTYVRMKTNE